MTSTPRERRPGPAEGPPAARAGAGATGPPPKPAGDPGLAVRAVRPLVSGLRALGHDPAPLLGAVGIEEAALGDPDARVPMSAVVGLLRSAVERTGDDNLGLHLAERADLASLDVHYYVMVSSPTLGGALERLGRYQRLIHDTSHVELAVTGEQAVLRHFLPGGRPAPRQSAEFLLAAWLRAGRVVTGVPWAPLEVRFAHPEPAGAAEMGRFFAAPIRFGTGETALVLPASLLALPCLRADPDLLAVLERFAAERLERAPRTEGFAERVRAALAEDLRGGQPGAGRLAARLRMSARTLQRHLAAEGATYRDVLDQVRRDVALRHLADDHLAIAEVAFVAGFSELSAFYRAVRRWTGRTPADYRAGARSRPAGTLPAHPRTVP